MKRFAAYLLLMVSISVVNAQLASALVMFIPVSKGEVPSMIQTPALRQALLAVPPLGGTSTVGSWNNCTLYYRGTQQSLQQLLDSIDQIENVQIHVSIDSSGKIGKAESTKFKPLNRPLVYQFSVSMSGYPLGRQKGSTIRETVSIVIHKSQGIDPSKLRLPKPKPIQGIPVTNTPVAKPSSSKTIK